MTHFKNENRILLSFIVLTFIFIIGYALYPFLISIEQANQWNIKKFDKNKHKYENIIYECEQIYHNLSEDEQHIELNNSSLPNSIMKMITNENLYLDYIIIQKKNNELIIDAKFDAYKAWQLRILNHVSLEYHSKNKYKKRPQKQSLKSSSITLGNGWEFYVDTDWL